MFDFHLERVFWDALQWFLLGFGAAVGLVWIVVWIVGSSGGHNR